MRINSLHRLKQQKNLKKEKLHELQRRYVSSFSAKDHLTQYNALQDKCAFHYFSKRPVKRHLKKLAKAINLQPLTTQNQKIINSLNGIMEVYKNQNIPSKNIKQECLSDVGKQVDKQNMAKKQFSEKKANSYSQIDPYTQIMKPNSIEKLKKLKLQIQKRKKDIAVNISIDYMQSKIKQSTKMFKPVKTTSQRRINSVSTQKNRQIERIQVLNQSKHQRLTNFINNKKKKLKITRRSQDQKQQQYLHQDFQEQK